MENEEKWGKLKVKEENEKCKGEKGLTKLKTFFSKWKFLP